MRAISAEPPGALKHGRLARVLCQQATAHAQVANVSIALCQRLHDIHYTPPVGGWEGKRAGGFGRWALQRFYERDEDRYFNFLREQYRLIVDFDDTRRGTHYGEWYSDQNPLERGKMMPVAG